MEPAGIEPLSAESRNHRQINALRDLLKDFGYLVVPFAPLSSRSRSLNSTESGQYLGNGLSFDGYPGD